MKTYNLFASWLVCAAAIAAGVGIEAWRYGVDMPLVAMVAAGSLYGMVFAFVHWLTEPLWWSKVKLVGAMISGLVLAMLGVCMGYYGTDGSEVFMTFAKTAVICGPFLGALSYFGALLPGGGDNTRS